MASRLMIFTRDFYFMLVLGGFSDVLTTNYDLFVCTARFQILSDVLGAVWVFSVALDGSTKGDTSYLDIRVRC